MNNLQINSRWRIHDGKLDEFKKLAEQCLSITKEKDKETLQFDWYFNQDQTECVIRETFPDSDALLVHISNLGELFGNLLQVGDLDAEIYGSPSQELLNTTAGINKKVYTFYQGK